MPAPEPGTVFFEEYEGRTLAYFQRYFWSGRFAHRAARASAMLGRMKVGTWRCQWCWEDLETHKRTDAQYCSEGCRKRAARARRADRLLP